MKTYSIIANQETVDYLQRLFFDIKMRKDIIVTLLSSDEDVTEKKPFVKYSKELASLECEYEEAKKELEKYYFPNDLIGKHEYTWNLDFQTNEILLTVNCECGIEICDSAIK